MSNKRITVEQEMQIVLARAKADAWTEGYLAGMDDAINDREPDAESNPYRERAVLGTGRGLPLGRVHSD